MVKNNRRSINSKNIVPPKVVRAARICLGTILIAVLHSRMYNSWNSEIPSLLYFTVLINMLIGIYYIVSSIFKRIRRNTITHALTIYILIVGLVFVLFLDHGFVSRIYTKLNEDTINPTIHYICMISSILNHYIMPLIVTVDYLILTDMRNTKIDYKILILPVFYLGIALYYGLSTGKYPYPFLDVDYLGGWPIFILVILAFASVLILVSFLLKIAKHNYSKQNRKIL